jgi:hypothetical protein
MKPRLADKLAALRNDLNCGHFILADAKDADMAWGAASPGPRSNAPVPSPTVGRAREGGDAGVGPAPFNSQYRSIVDFRDQMREVVRQGHVDILLASASTMSVLAHRERLFDSSEVTPAIRANDATDVWLPRGGRYRDEPSRPFSTCYLEEVQYGKGKGDGSLFQQTSPDTNPAAQSKKTPVPFSRPVVNLGLYSVTFNNRLDADYATLAAFREFRAYAQRCGFHYFLEVFAPNLADAVAPDETAAFVNDHICRMLAGVPVTARPEFLKIPYFGPAALEELVAYDPSMIVGVLGGGSGTTYDAFKLLSEAKRHGARAALFGRKIKDAEHPLTMVALLRRIADGETTAEDAVKAYHGELEKLGIKPKRTLREDSELTACELSYATRK